MSAEAWRSIDPLTLEELAQEAGKHALSTLDVPIESPLPLSPARQRKIRQLNAWTTAGRSAYRAEAEKRIEEQVREFNDWLNTINADDFVHNIH